jgi:purine-binding chemotaxis protein CheW
VAGDDNYLLFHLDDHRFAVRLDAVRRVLPAAAPTPLPEAPGVVLGVSNVAGRPVPVVNARLRFGLPQRPFRTSDQFLLLDTGSREMAVWVDATGEVFAAPEPAPGRGQENIWPGLEYVHGVALLHGDVVCIHDPERFFTGPEAEQLDQALSTVEREG